MSISLLVSCESFVWFCSQDNITIDQTLRIWICLLKCEATSEVFTKVRIAGVLASQWLRHGNSSKQGSFLFKSRDYWRGQQHYPKDNYQKSLWWVCPGWQPSTHPVALALPIFSMMGENRTGARQLMGGAKDKEVTYQLVWQAQ